MATRGRPDSETFLAPGFEGAIAMGTPNQERAPYGATGYRMIENVQIRNFRCFKQASLTNCGRINVIVGRNASGKTALLEALFLASGPSPEVALRLKQWRGFDSGAATGTFAQIDEAMWSDLFFNYDKSRAVEIALFGSDNHTRSLTISYGKVEESFGLSSRQAVSLSGAMFKWTRYDEETFLIRPEFTRGGFVFAGTDIQPIPGMFFASSHPFLNQENTQRFSELSKKRRVQPFISAMKREFDFINDIDIQSFVGQALLHADIPTLPEKVPLVSISSGVNKLSSILLALSMEDRYIVCIDEIENGIHYSRLESAWAAMFKMATDNHAQIFASTHSGECLDALANVFESHPNDMTLTRTEIEDGEAIVEQFRGETAIKSIKAGEVR
jgi:AAA15 family ATPase/GTPase